MKEPHTEGVASHCGPESCGGVREGVTEALTGVRAGEVSSREIITSECRRVVGLEGNTVRCAIASAGSAPRGPRPSACTEISMRENREIPQTARARW